MGPAIGAHSEFLRGGRVVLIRSPATFVTALVLSQVCRADGVCKTDKMPIDYVAVKEFVSPQCPGYSENPFVKNAWEVERAGEGIVACALPSYREIGAQAASLVPCDPVLGEQCPQRSDGLPNAIVLRSPSLCASRSLPKDLRVVCSNDAPVPPLLESHLTREPGTRWNMIGEFESAKCPTFDPSSVKVRDQVVPTKNAYLARRRTAQSAEWLAVCASQYNLNPADVVVRRFHNPNCPESPRRVLGADLGLNAWIVAPLDSFYGKTIVACVKWLQPEPMAQRARRSMPSKAKPAQSSERERSPTGMKAIPPGTMPPLVLQYLDGMRAPTVYAEECGGPTNVKNAYSLNLDGAGNLIGEPGGAAGPMRPPSRYRP